MRTFREGGGKDKCGREIATSSQSLIGTMGLCLARLFLYDLLFVKPFLRINTGALLSFTLFNNDPWSNSRNSLTCKMNVLNRAIRLKTRFDLSKYCGRIRSSPLPRIERKIGSRIFTAINYPIKPFCFIVLILQGYLKFVADIFRTPPQNNFLKSDHKTVQVV